MDLKKLKIIEDLPLHDGTDNAAKNLITLQELLADEDNFLFKLVKKLENYYYGIDELTDEEKLFLYHMKYNVGASFILHHEYFSNHGDSVFSLLFYIAPNLQKKEDIEPGFIISVIEDFRKKTTTVECNFKNVEDDIQESLFDFCLSRICDLFYNLNVN
jgi:hypothetical protein